MKFANLLQTRLEAIGSRLSEVQTKNFLWGFVKNTLVWHNAQGRGAEKQRWRERRADIRDFFIFLNLARARARARRPENQAPGGAWFSAPRVEGGRNPCVCGRMFLLRFVFLFIRM